MIQSLYVHIPFCRKKCLYCNFYSIAYDSGIAGRYIDVIARQTELLDNKFSTVYVGGGTPTVLKGSQLKKLLSGIKKVCRKDVEFTVEANPESLSKDVIGLFLDYGVNRLSIGVQSFDDAKLRRLGRIHNAIQAREAVRLVRKKGFRNISIDLIYGVWEEGSRGWEKDLAEAVKMPVQHISCYGLTYEKDALLYGSLKGGRIKPVDDELAAQMYETTMDFLAEKGFRQYEISNFAREGFECRHNLNYWANDSYLGLGASAFSYLDYVRSGNIADVYEYIKRSDEGKPVFSSQEKLSPVRRARETAALKIRTAGGIEFDNFRKKTGFNFSDLENGVLDRLVENGLVRYRKKKGVPAGIYLKRKGFLLCDIVCSELL